MSGKARRVKGKHLSQIKRRKSGRRLDLERRGSLAIATQQQAIAQSREPVSRPSVSAPSASVPTPMAKLAAVRSPYIASELRTIGILAGIMIIILAILALVLS